MPRPRRIIPATVLAALTLIAPAAFGHDFHDQKQEVDGRIAALQTQIREAKAREGVLTSDIAAASTAI
jgi:hypothetical protein